MFNTIMSIPRKILTGFSLLFSVIRFLPKMPGWYDSNLFHQTRQLQNSHPNPLNRFGKKCFSQTDEDGITIEILRRMGILSSGVFAEFGVGDGTENNTLILASLGWDGFWVGGQSLAFDSETIPDERFVFIRDWITQDNIVDLATSALEKIDKKLIDVASLDLDGNDLVLVRELLANDIRPKLFIVEYNAKFPPPVEFSVTYDANHTWNGDDYFGASLQSFTNMFAEFSYRLVCCNSHTGANAFYVAKEYATLFPDVPSDINEIYVEPRYHLYEKYGHRKSLKVIEKVFQKPRVSN